jgi:hypothetical protein
MARHPRFVLVGHPQLMIIRGNNRGPIFISDEDYYFYLEKLKQACDKHKCQIQCLCINDKPCSYAYNTIYRKWHIESDANGRTLLCSVFQLDI